MKIQPNISGYAAVQMMHQGSLKPSALMHTFVERIREREPLVGAFECLDLERAMGQARALDRQPASGLLFGLPIGVKDLIDTIEFPASYGSPIYAGHQPAWDAPCVVQTKIQGGIIIGKTVTTEFAAFHPGKTVNPHHPAHTPGGSSSGSAASVADGMIPMAFGTQTVASIYRPASFCGVVGFKPTFGLINRCGVKQLSDSLDTIGVLTHDVRDAALFAAAAAHRPDLVISGAEAINSPSIGVFRTAEWEMAEPYVREQLERYAASLSGRGARVIDIAIPPIFSDLVSAQTDLMIAETALALSYEYHQHRDKLSARLIEVIESGLQVTPERLVQAQRIITAARAEIDCIFSGIDVLIAPAVRTEAPVGIASTGDPLFGRVWSALGNPGIVLPNGKGPKGLPVGILMTGPSREDKKLLQIAHWASTTADC